MGWSQAAGKSKKKKTCVSNSETCTATPWPPVLCFSRGGGQSGRLLASRTLDRWAEPHPSCLQPSTLYKLLLFSGHIKVTDVVVPTRSKKKISAFAKIQFCVYQLTMLAGRVWSCNSRVVRKGRMSHSVCVDRAPGYHWGSSREQGWWGFLWELTFWLEAGRPEETKKEPTNELMR